MYDRDGPIGHWEKDALSHKWCWDNCLSLWEKNEIEGFPGGAVVKNPPANAGDTGSNPGLGRSHMPRSN